MMLWHVAAAALVAAAAGAWGGWQLRDLQADADELARVQQEQRDSLRRQEAAYGASQRHEQDGQQRREQIRTVIQEVERVVERPVYSAVCLDPDGLRLIAAAIGPATAASQPGPALPAASSPR